VELLEFFMINPVVIKLDEMVEVRSTVISLERIANNRSQGTGEYISIVQTGKHSYQLQEYASKLSLLWDQFLHILSIRKGTVYTGQKGLERVCQNISATLSSFLQNPQCYININPATINMLKTALLGLQYLCAQAPDSAASLVSILEKMHQVIQEIEAYSVLSASDTKENLIQLYEPVFRLNDFKENPVGCLQGVLGHVDLLYSIWEKYDTQIKQQKKVEQEIFQEKETLKELEREFSETTKKYTEVSQMIETENSRLQKISQNVGVLQEKAKKAQHVLDNTVEMHNNMAKELVRLDEQLEKYRSLEGLEEEFAALGKIQEALCVKWGEGTSKQKQIEEKIEKVSEEMRNKQLQIDEIKKTLEPKQELEEQYKKLEEEMERLSYSCGQLQEEIDTCNKKEGLMKDILLSIIQGIESKTSEVSFLKEKMTTLSNEIEEHKSELETLEQTMEKWKEHPLSIEDLRVQQGNLLYILKMRGIDPQQGSLDDLNADDLATHLSSGTIARIICAMAKREKFSHGLFQTIAKEIREALLHKSI
jgi:myosin heavy subunit